MKGYGQFCPVAKTAEILAERWMPLVLRELLSGENRFNDIQRGVPLMSRSLLAKRLRELERAGIVEKRRSGARGGPRYVLTPAGEELRPLIEGMGAWGQRWLLLEVDEEDLDPSLLMWDMRRNLVRERVPDRRVVVRFDFDDVAGKMARWWLIVEPAEATICMTDPGFEVDLRVAVTQRALTRYWLGQIDWRQLLASGMELDGPRWMVQGLPVWLGRSPLAGVPRVSQGAPAPAGAPG